MTFGFFNYRSPHLSIADGTDSAVLILEQMFGFSPPLGAKNQTSAGVSGRRRRPETPADFHNEN
jgi:hypothetical protein